MAGEPTTRRTVWIVFRHSSDKLAGVVTVHASKDDAFEDLDIRTGRGQRPDLEVKYGLESWIVLSERPDDDLAAAHREGWDAALVAMRTAVEGLVPEMVRKDYLVPVPKWDDLIDRAAVLAVLAVLARLTDEGPKT